MFTRSVRSALTLLIVGLSMVGAQSASAQNSTTADVVYGQLGSFTTNTQNKGGISANSLNEPPGVALDSSGNLYVADFANNRVLFYPSGSTTATRVYGQGGSFTTNTANNGGISANSIYNPTGVALDSSGNLYVVDFANNRVLFYPSGSTTATRVYGQGGSFTTNTPNKGGVSANSLDEPEGVALDSSGNLYVGDTYNNRVLFYSPGSTTAEGVYGQLGSFTTNISNKGGISADSLYLPYGVVLDSSDNLRLADTFNSRVLFYPSRSTTATGVYGQLGSFTTGTPNKGGISADSLYFPFGVALNSSGNLYVADVDNSRVLAYPLAFYNACVNNFFSCNAWPQFRYDANNDGNNTVEKLLTTSNVAQLTQTYWSPVALNPGANTSPVTDGENVYVLDTNNLYALNQHTGSNVTGFPYHYNTAGCPSSPVAFSYSSFFKPASVVYFYDACSRNPPANCSGSPVGGTLYAISVNTGTVQWCANVPPGSTVSNDSVHASPTVAYIYPLGPLGIFLAEDYVYAFDASNGSPLSTWVSGPNVGESQYPVNGGTSSSAIGTNLRGVVNDTLFVGSSSGPGSSNGIVAINTGNGVGLPSVSNQGAVSYSSPSAPLLNCGLYCVPDPTQFVIAGTSLSGGATGQVADFNPQKWSTSPWQFLFTGPVSAIDIYNISYESSPAVASEVIGGQPQNLAYVGSSFLVCYPYNCPPGPPPPMPPQGIYYYAGYLTALDASNGNPVWQSGQLNPIGFSSPAVANGVVFVADLGGSANNYNFAVNAQIYAFGASGTGCLLPNGPACQPLWQNDLGYIGQPEQLGSPTDQIGSPAVSDGMVFETAGGALYAFCVPYVSC
jgi:sugar lactone lactonase YvrE